MKKRYWIMFSIGVIAFLIIAVNWNKPNQESREVNVVGLDIGQIAPSFTVQTIDGKRVTRDDLNGKVIVITSSAAWCQTCVAEARQFAAAYQSLPADKIYFLTVDIDPNVTTQQMRQFRKDNETPWDYVSARGGRDIINKFKLRRFEITYVIDQAGVIRYKDNFITSADELEKAVQATLGV